MSNKLQKRYVEAVKADDHVLTVAEFKEDCDSGMFIDYDGFGHPVRDGLADPDIWVYPSKRDIDIPEDATHIVWYNR